MSQAQRIAPPTSFTRHPRTEQIIITSMRNTRQKKYLKVLSMFDDRTKTGRIQFTPQFASAGFIWSHLLSFAKRGLRSSGPLGTSPSYLIIAQCMRRSPRCKTRGPEMRFPLRKRTLRMHEAYEVIWYILGRKCQTTTLPEIGTSRNRIGPFLSRKLIVRIRPPSIAYRQGLFPFTFKEEPF